MNRPVNIGLSPNLEGDDVRLALKVLFLGGDSDAKKNLVAWFERYFPGFSAIPFNSGRSAEWAIIKALGLTSHDEVLVQDFTCVAVPNSVHWAGAKTVDVKVKTGTFNMDPDDLLAKITSKSRAVIVQHTFGQSADLARISKICRDHKLVLIEDCAHALGASHKKRLLGTWGDVAFFSLGRDKVVSSVFGGVAITNDVGLARRLAQVESQLPNNSLGWIIQQVLHPLLTWLFLPLYNVGIGKGGLWLAQQLGLLSKAVYVEEKRGVQPNCFPAKYSQALMTLGLNQLKKLDRFNRHRQKIAKIYVDNLASSGLVLPPISEGDVYLRFTVMHPRARELYLRAKLEKKWVLGDWYLPSRQVINLPTYPTFSEQEALVLCTQLKLWLKFKK